MSLQRYAKKRDASERAIVTALERVGAQCVTLDDFDLLVLFRAQVYLLECKTGKGRITPTQQDLIERGWPLHIVSTADDALKAIGAISGKTAARMTD